MKQLQILIVTIFGLLGNLSSQADEVKYEVWDANLTAYVAKADQAKGTVVILHTFGGLSDFERSKADALAELGYTAFAADLYGDALQPDTLKDKQQAMGELFAYREGLQERLVESVKAARKHGPDPLVVIGYSMGGGALMELVRTKLGKEHNIAGYATFFGRLSDSLGRPLTSVQAPMLILHGGADSVLPIEQTTSFSSQMEESSGNYQINIYSGAKHMFSVPGHPHYDMQADEASWATFLSFIAKLGDTN